MYGGDRVKSVYILFRKVAAPPTPPEGREKFYTLFLPKAKIRAYNLSDKIKDLHRRKYEARLHREPYRPTKWNVQKSLRYEHCHCEESARRRGNPPQLYSYILMRLPRCFTAFRSSQ